MATAQKQTGGSHSKKGGLLNKIKAMLPLTGKKKAKKKPQPVMTKAAKMAADFDDAIEIPKDKSTTSPMSEKLDKAHSPGHRKMSLKGQFAEPTGIKVKAQASAINDIAPSERIKQLETPQRRVQGKMVAGARKSRRGSSKSH